MSRVKDTEKIFARLRNQVDVMLSLRADHAEHEGENLKDLLLELERLMIDYVIADDLMGALPIGIVDSTITEYVNTNGRVDVPAIKEELLLNHRIDISEPALVKRVHNIYHD